MLSDILIAVGIGAVILGLIYAIFSSARTAQKGNAPVSEHAVSNKSSKKQQQQKSDDEEESSVPAKKNNNTSTTNNTNNNTKQRSTSPKKKSASPAGSSASSNNSGNNNKTKKADNNKKADKKAAKKAREEEEAELDAIVEAEMKRSLATGIRKEKFEVINLDAVHKVKENKAARQEKKSEGASFNEKQIASEKAAGFRVVGAQEAAKKEHTAANAKSSSPASRSEGKKNKSNNNGGGAMTREEELDLALRSVLSKRGGNKRGGVDAGAFRPRREENSPEEERGFVELKGEIKASTPGGAWVRK